MPTSEARALPFFTDTNGRPLESGSIYIGVAGLDPIANPQPAYSDANATLALASPVRTTRGHATASGALVHIYTSVPYSITIQDAAGRTVYTSLSETDSSLATFSTSTVQSAASPDVLRARSGPDTNQVWVNGYGMYVYDSTDTTTPESVPTVFVGNDGSRYKLSYQYVRGLWLLASSAALPNVQGTHISWNDTAGDGKSYFTNNRGSGTGGFIWRCVNADNSVESGRLSMDTVGNLTTGGFLKNAFSQTTAGAVPSSQGTYTSWNDSGTDGKSYFTNNRGAGVGGFVWRCVSADGTAESGRMAMDASGNLSANNSAVITAATLSAAILANQLALGIGAVALGNTTGPNVGSGGTLPGTWVSAGSDDNSVHLWVRSA